MPTSFFTEAELHELADCLAEITGTAELLGRARIARRAEQVAKHGEAEDFTEQPTDLSCFDETIHPQPPARALAYFRALVPTLHVDHAEFLERTGTRAFGLAHATEQGVLDRVKGVIEDRLESGQGLRLAPREIDDILAESGVTAPNGYSKMVVRTNMMQSYTQGAMKAIQAPGMEETFPVWRYLGIDDGRQREAHEAHFDKYYSNDTDFEEVRDAIKGDFDGYNCILPGQRLQGRISAGSKARYAGEAIQLETVTPNLPSLSVTPNHPVLTTRGFIPAGQIREGDYLLRYVGEDQAATEGNYKENVPTLVEEVFRSFCNISKMILPSEVATVPLDFHGDARGFKGKIQIVRPYGELRNDDITQTPERIHQGCFVGHRSNQRGLVTGGSGHPGFHAVRLAPSIFMGRPGLSFSFLRPHLGPLQKFSLMLAANRNVSKFQTNPDDISRNVESVGKLILRFPRLVTSNDFLNMPRDWRNGATAFGGAARLDAGLAQPAGHSLTLDAKLRADLIGRFPGLVTLDKVRKIRRFHFEGPVYDFESPLGWIVAGNTFISNCRCGPQPVSKYDWAKAQTAGAQLDNVENYAEKFSEPAGPGLLDVPDIRQTDSYSCGAASACCVGKFFGVGPTTLDAWKKALGTDVEESTRPDAIVSYLTSLGLEAVPRQDMTLEDLRAAWLAGKPVICPVQDYGDEVPDKNNPAKTSSAVSFYLKTSSSPDAQTIMRLACAAVKAAKPKEN